VRLTGTVQLDGAPVANARLTLFDLGTGATLPAKPWAAQRSLRLRGTGELRTDARGAFDLELAQLGRDQLVKVVASADGRTFVTLVGGGGETLEQAPSASTGYTLAQAGSTTSLALTAASTAAAKAFEGVLKLALQRSGASQGEALRTAREAAAALEPRLAARPDAALALLESLDERGEVADLDAFRAALSRAGAFDTLHETVRVRLNALAGAFKPPEPDAAPVTAEDFPLLRVAIGADGTLTFTGQQGSLVLGASGYEPTPPRGRRRRPAPQALGPTSFRVLVGLPNDSRGLATYDDQTSLVAWGHQARSFIDPVSGEDHDPGFSGEDAYSVAADPTNGRFFLGRNASVWSCPMPLGGPQAIDQGGDAAAYALAVGTTHLYALGDDRINRYLLADTSQPATRVQVAGIDYVPAGTGHYGLALEDTGASPTLYTGNDEGEVYSLQDGGATHTLLASGLGQLRGLAFSAPNRTLYLASYDRQQVYALHVDTRATATVTLDPPLSPTYRPWGVALSRDGRSLNVSQHVIPPPPP
jgi:hypothetical protein